MFVFLSTLSLRRATAEETAESDGRVISIHALLAESDSARSLFSIHFSHFYPRSPCGERPFAAHVGRRKLRISIHALLAESDASNSAAIRKNTNFYPRSPCGERPSQRSRSFLSISISIHALLAESDIHLAFFHSAVNISIHALLAESDSEVSERVPLAEYFYPRSPCGERPE